MSSEEGGRLAAELLIEFLDGANTEKTVLIVAGKSQVKRQEEFMKRLSDETAWKVIPNADGKFSRTRAREIVEGWLSGDSIPDAIFCTCDSMTLGCLDALNNNKKKGSKVMVIGYDGIPETLQLVRDRRSPLRGLVEQDPERVAVEAAHMLAQLISTVELNEQFEPAKLLKPNRVPESGWRDNTRKSTP
jgi:ABC-type sugar transport system substrate-binding protein